MFCYLCGCRAAAALLLLGFKGRCCSGIEGLLCMGRHTRGATLGLVCAWAECWFSGLGQRSRGSWERAGAALPEPPRSEEGWGSCCRKSHLWSLCGCSSCVWVWVYPPHLTVLVLSRHTNLAECQVREMAYFKLEQAFTCRFYALVLGFSCYCWFNPSKCKTYCLWLCS